MAVQAAVELFKQETVEAFRQKRSLLSQCARKESMMNGLQVTFLVSGSTGDTAVTRGQNGHIPYNSPTNTQVTATLTENHAPYSLTGFDVFASQGNQTQIMREEALAVINRTMDTAILAELANATQDFGSGPLELNTVAGAVAILGNNFVPVDEMENMFGIMSPSAYAYLWQTAEFSSKDYVEVTLMNGATRRMINWGGVNWITSSLVTGLGTASEILYIFHRNALGYAIAMGEEKIFAGYDEKQGESWCRAELFHAPKILQNTGIIKITHDGSEYVAT